MNPEPALRISDKTRMATKADGTRIPVVDAKAKFIVRVTQKHIDAAVPNSSTHCMYCLACMEQHGSELVWVTRTRAYVELSTVAGTSELVRCILPPIVIKYLRTHDMELKHLIKPHTVTFDPPAPYQRLEATYVRNFRANQRLAEKRRAASAKRKALNLGRIAAHLPPLKASDPIPIPEFLQPEPALPSPEPKPLSPSKPRKKQDPTTNFDLRPGGRGDFCFYPRIQ